MISNDTLMLKSCMFHLNRTTSSSLAPLIKQHLCHVTFCWGIKSEISCDKHRAGLQKLQCDENCVETQKTLEQARQKEEELRRKLEEERNRLEVEQFEKKFSKRKPKERKSLEVKQKDPINWKLVGVYAGIFAAVMLAVALAFYEEH